MFMKSNDDIGGHGSKQDGVLSNDVSQNKIYFLSKQTK